MSRVVIIGAGVIGCATAYYLAERGVTDIVILDRDSVGSGGTGKSAGIIRCHYGVSAIASLALRSLDFFANAKELLGADIGFEQVGYVVGVGEANVEPFSASVANQQSLGVNTSLIDHATVQELWPTAHLDDFAAFCFEPEGGYGDGYATAQALAATLRSRGVSIRQGTKVAAVEAAGGRVTGVVLADGERVGADVVVLAAGPWSMPLAAGLGIELPIKPMLVQEVLIDPQQDLGAPPVFSDLVSMQYVHVRGQELLFGNSAGEGSIVPLADPDKAPGRASDQAVEATAEKALHRFPGILDPRVSTTSTGVLDTTPDSNPIVSATDIEGMYVAAGMSGHGFKIAPALGEMTAGLILDGGTSIPGVDANAFRLSRYADGEPLVSPFPYVGAHGIR